jgi:hypothetical protein
MHIAKRACYLCAANERAGYDDAKKDQKNAEQYSQQLARLMCEELRFGAAAPQCFSDLCLAAGRHTANIRAGQENEATRDKAQVRTCCTGCAAGQRPACPSTALICCLTGCAACLAPARCSVLRAANLVGPM